MTDGAFPPGATAVRRDVLDCATALVAAHDGPFAHDWSDFRPDPDWPIPTLPPDALTVSR